VIRKCIHSLIKDMEDGFRISDYTPHSMNPDPDSVFLLFSPGQGLQPEAGNSWASCFFVFHRREKN
jgi:hypothetical protein